MQLIDNFNFAGKKAIVRVDFNVPLDENGKITDDTRIRGALPTLKHILDNGGALIIMSHMGKPKGKVNAKMSLSQIVDAVSAALGVPVKFAPDCAIFGGVISGIGSGLTIRFGGAIDGIDVLSVIFAKKLGLSLGTFVMIFNSMLAMLRTLKAMLTPG